MKLTLALLLAALALASTVTATAQQPAATPAPIAATADMASGEVRKVYPDAGQILLKHGEIKSLDMPPMSMVFKVKDKALLDRVKVGDKVRFKAAQIGGEYTVTELQVVP